MRTARSQTQRESKSIAGVPEWGIEPVPRDLRRFGGVDTLVLWFNLGISLLLPIVAAFLVPGLSFARAALAIGVGVVVGNVMLGYAGKIGAATGAPAMVLYRASLGSAGSFGPTVLNIAQNVGWGSLELLIIGTAAAAASERVFGFSGRLVWTLVFGVIVTLMAIGGPLVVVRQWVRRYAVWLVLASSVYLTVYVVTTAPLGSLLNSRGEGMPFWQGVDLVVAMPISWIPLAADYTRFASTRRAAFAGTAVGYGIAQAWFYLLGVLLIGSKVAENPADPTAFVGAVLAVPAGLLALGILAVDETDEAFANIYSASVSTQNAFPRLGQRRLSLLIGAVCTLLAIVVPLVQYENFLLLIGAVFVPFFGVQAAHYTIVRRGYTHADLYGPNQPRIMTWGCLCWVAGFVTYNWLNPGTVSWWVSAMTWLLGPLPAPTTLVSASIASFVVAFVLQAAQALTSRDARPAIRASAP